MHQRNVLNSPRLLKLKKGRRKIFLSKILLFIFALATICALLVYLSRIPTLNISEVEIKASRVIDTEKIRAVVLKKIDGNYLWLFPRSNIFFYPKNSIKEELHKEFKRIKDISFTLEKSKTLSITLLEKDAEYVWCGEKLPESEIKSEDYECYFMDGDGHVFDKAPYISGNVYFKFFGPLSLQYFSPDIFKKIIDFKNAVTSMGIEPVSLYMKDTGDLEIYLSSNSTAREGPKMLLRKDFDLEKTLLNFQAAITTEPLKSNLKNKYSSLLYIDLRYGNRIYYKFKGE